jgi:hypothetical protein
MLNRFGKSTFQQLDTNNDGQLDAAEMRGGDFAGIDMAALDSDGDGVLTEDEFGGMAAQMAAEGGGPTIVSVSDLAAKLDGIAEELKTLKMNQKPAMQETSFGSVESDDDLNL